LARILTAGRQRQRGATKGQTHGAGRTLTTKAFLPWLRGMQQYTSGIVLAREPCREEGSPQLTIVGLRQ
jgi:hypothetical protein